MAAVPKNKRSKAKKNTKRNSFKLSVLSIVECPRCRAKKIAHRVCQACGYYNNKEIIKLEKKTKEKGSEKTRETAGTSAKNTEKQKSAKNQKQNKTEVKDKSPEISGMTDKTEDDTVKKAANS